MCIIIMRKIDRTAVEIYLKEGKSDKEIAERLSCSPDTIRNIRNRVFGIRRVRQYDKDKLRKLYWLSKNNAFHTVYGSTISVPLGYYKELGLMPGKKMNYKIKVLTPNKLIIELIKDDM